MTNDISCPVDHVPISENRVRITAFLVFLAALTFLFSGYWPVALLLALDFFLRSFGYGAYSPFFVFSGWLGKRIIISVKLVDRAPKVFAARLGFVFSDCLLIAAACGVKPMAYGLVALLLIFSFLESVFGFCAGCVVYSVLKKLFPKTTAL
jgi:hypothetical protein